MKSPRFLLIIFAILFSAIAFAQSTVTGKIIDAETKLPLEGASVFAQNTTKGTVTNKEGDYSLYLNKGGYELVVSFTGYESRTINFEAVADRQFNLEMQKADNSLSEVVIRSSNEVTDGWAQYGQFFIDHFIGTTPLADSCTLLNPQALKFYFYKRTNKLKVLATEPLQIQNRFLGYNLNYALDSFVHFYEKDINSYRGNCLYTQMEGNWNERQKWNEEREKVYYGSRLQFMRSYYNRTLKPDGFTVDILASANSNKFYRLANPYDTAYYYFEDSTASAELWFPTKVSIGYNKQAPEKKYLEHAKLPPNVPIQLSYVDLTDAILIKPNGYFFDQKSWINQGYWSWKNLADQLPYDYEVEK